MKKILLLNCPTIIKQVFCFFNYELIDIKETNQQLGYLLGLEGYISNTNKSVKINDSMMIFYGLDDNDLDGVLQILKLNSIKIDLKAVVTEHNINWTVSYLKEELNKEKQVIKTLKH